MCATTLGFAGLVPRMRTRTLPGAPPSTSPEKHRMELLVLSKGLPDLRGGPAALRRLLVPQHERGMLACGARDYPRLEMDTPGLAAGTHHQWRHRRREIRRDLDL